jgi:undecaprenyl pyrophosphate phosphatase UppP
LQIIGDAVLSIINGIPNFLPISATSLMMAFVASEYAGVQATFALSAAWTKFTLLLKANWLGLLLTGITIAVTAFTLFG